jgi:hypothetical protein
MKTFASKAWIPASAGMTTKLKDPAGGWLHFLHKDSKERQTPLEIPAGHYF